uniref:Zonadhesin n=1 Tax=Gadus morhua TaxID=8049 RepID=A0A8C4Z5E9_GADMO
VLGDTFLSLWPPQSDRPSERSAKGVMVGRGICTIHTDPQCSTFDGALFRFMAPCTYILAKTCVPIRGLPVFSVEVVNTQDAINASEATVERINVEVNNVRLSLLKRETKRVMVNGVWRSLPLTILGATVKIRNNPAVVTVETDDRVLISYDNAGAVHLKLPSAYAGKVCGMCGNFNSLGEDDNRRPDGSAARDATDLALSWQTGAHAGPCDAVLVPHVCDPLEELSYGSRQFCGELLSTTGPFSRCLPVLGVESYYRSCVAGMCVSHGDLDAMCHTMQSYAKICYDAGVAVPAWRNGTTCTLECGANSHYEACADRCLDGCSSMDLAGTCGPCEERCVCDKGYKLSGGVCVLAENCGCWNDGRHYEKGAVFVHGGCTQRCQCLGNGQTLCSAWGCSGSQVCKDKDGVKGCFTPETVTCSMYGDPHYITYDGKAYDFQGGCNYTLATTCGEKTPVRFTVTGRNANPTDQNLTRSKLETVVLQIQELHLTLQQNRKVYVRLPYTVDGSYGLLKVTRQRQFVVVETGVGLRVMIDGQNRLFLQVDERYKGQLCGMCGTYSDWQGDDFVRPDWSNATGAFDFGNSWRKDRSCIALPDDPKVCDEQGDEQAVSDCSAILDDSFSACHKPVHPLKYVSSCVYDHCATSGDLHTLCDSLESYRAACQVAGVELPAWQNNTACGRCPTGTPLTPAPTPDQTLCALNCNFDSHVCGWQQLIQDSFDWTRQSGPTPSFSTGPNEDHTGEGYYMYIEGDGMTHGNSARLLSAQCNYRGPLCLQFWYHMHGSASAMALNIYHLHAVQAEKVWSMVNDQGSEWHQAFVDIKEKGTFQIIIEAIRGSTALSDVAIDDISIQFGSCSSEDVRYHGPPCVPAPGQTGRVCKMNCDFEQDLCEWNQMVTDVFDWTRHNGSSPTIRTGPSSDHMAGGHYLYIEANSATYGDTARLLSSECSHTGPQCLRFWYHMYGSADTMGLHVYLLQDRLANSVWGKRNDQGDVWKEAMVDLTTDGPFRIIFEGRRGSNDQSDAAIDDVSLRPGHCAGKLFKKPQPQTTEEVPHPTTEGVPRPTTARPQPQTTGVPHPTTARPQPQTTEGVPHPTTARPQPPTTEGVPHPTTARPQPPTTEGVPHPTTEGVPHPTTARPQPPTTEGVPRPTTARPQPQTTTTLPLTPTNQHTPCMSPCQPTCTRPQGPPGCRRTSPCKQGCVCDAGYVLKWNAACVPIRQCGCVDRDGSVHNFNDKWYTAHCRQKCECKKDDRVGEVDCDDEDECDGDGVCLPNTSGQYKCLSTDFKECTIKGDPEYRTFDDRKHKFRGDHSYVLAQTTSQSRTLPGFYVEGINTHDEGDGDHSEDSDERSSEDDEDDEDYDDDSEENNRRHRLREMKIRVYNHTVEFKRNGVLVVDGWVSHPPISPSGGLSIRKHSSRLYLNTDFGLSVTFDGHSQAEIILPHIYRRKVAGLCGNFDGKKKNDFMKPDGRPNILKLKGLCKAFLSLAN